MAFPLLLGAALVAAWVVPDMMDWDRYRATIEVLASTALGRQVRIEGRITLELLPEPLLTATEVHIDSQPEDNSGAEISARELRLGIAPAALLQGNIDARDLVLRDPVMRLPWPLPAGLLAFHRPPWLAALSARIEGGTLEMGAVRFSGIDATLAAGDATGGYRLVGVARRDGDWRFTARLGGRGNDGAAGVDLTLDGVGTRQGLGVRFAGQLDAEGMLAGRLDAQGPDLSRLLPAPAVPFRAGGRLTLASGLLAADELALDIGGSPAKGAVALRLLPHPRLDLAVAASRLDLDAWLPALLQAPSAAYPVGVDLSAEAAQLFGGMLRRLRVAFDVAAVDDDPQTRVSLREASAILPGDATLHLQGSLSRADANQPRFVGSASLAAPAFQTTRQWLETGVLKPFAALPADVLRTLDVSAAVSGDAEHLSLSGLHGQLDGASLDGTLSIGFGPRLLLKGDLTTDHLPLDRWLPENWPGLVAFPTALAPFDADMRLSAAHAAYHGADIVPLSLDLAFDNTRLRLRHLDATWQGVAAQISGSIGEGGRITDGQLHTATKDATVILPFLPTAWRIPALWRGSAALQMEAAGPPGALSVKASGDLGDLRLEAQPTLDLTRHAWVGPLTLRHPGAPRLFETLGLRGAPAWLGDGSFSLVAGLSGTLAQMKLDKLELVAGSLRASGQLALDQPAGAAPTLSGQINAETLPLPEIYLRGLEPIWPNRVTHPFQANLQVRADQVLIGLVPTLEHVQSGVALTEAGLKLEGLKAGFLGGTLTGTAAFDTASAPPVLHAEMALAGATLDDGLSLPPLDLSSGTLGGSLAVTASGYSPAALVATLAGEAHLSVQDGAMRGVNLGQLTDGLQHGANDADLSAALTSGATDFQTLDADAAIKNGRIVLRQAHLQAASGGADLTGAIDMAGAAMDLRVTALPNFPDAPRPSVRFTGPFESVRRIPELTAVAGWRAVSGTDAKP